MNNYSSSIAYSKETIPFDVSYVNRKTMEIAVHPDAQVVVKAPRDITLDAIKARLVRRAHWIRKQIDYFRQFQPKPPPRRYIGGETHMFLGQQYRLKLRKQQEDDVRLKGGYFFVRTPSPNNPERVKSLLDEWYEEHAWSVFSRRLRLCCECARSLKVPIPKIRVRKMSKRWGSCGKSGDILLNIDLVKASLYCIDYVIMHELCHTKVPTHHNGYYKLLSKYMPDWKERKKRLEKVFT